jgi:TRAP transporter TAXI family solute receptor
MTRRGLTCIFVIGAIVLFYLTPAKAQDAKGMPKTASIATHPKGSLLNFIGGGFAKVITSYTPIKASDRPFTGYMAWVPLMDNGELDMGIVTSPESYTAYMGEGPYKQPLKNLRVISVGASVLLSYVVRADSGIKTMAELKGKRVAMDRASYVTKTENEVSVQAAGLDLKKDITAVPVAGVAELMYSVMDGRADAGWASVGSSQVKEVAGRVGGVRWLSLAGGPDDAAAKLIKEKVAGSRIVQIKAGQDPDVKNDAWIMDTPIYLATHKNFSDEAVYQALKVALQNQQELVSVHPVFKGWTAKGSVSPDAAIPYHPGAIRYYKEVGLWSDAMEAVQKKLLSR